MNKIWILQNLKIFENISKEGIEIIDSLSEMEHYKRNDPIYIEASTLNYVYILKKGNIKISLSTEDGKEFTIEILKPDEIFGNFGDNDQPGGLLFNNSGGNKRSFDFLNAENAFALNDVEVCKFNKVDFDKILNLYPIVSSRILKLIGLRFKYITTKITSLAYKSLDSRIAEVLIYLLDNFRVKNNIPSGIVIKNVLTSPLNTALENNYMINIKLTHEEIANLVGASRQRTTMALDKLKEAGIIDFYKKKIIVKNIEMLKNLIK